MKKATQAIRWVWAGLALGLGPLYFFHAPTIFLFKVQLVLTEFGHWLALPSLFLALMPWPHAARNARLACGLAALLFLSPAGRAWVKAPSLESETSLQWPSSPPNLSPAFTWSRLFVSDAPNPALRHDSETYSAKDGLALTCWRLASPKGEKPFVLVVHGGGWDGGQRNDFPRWDAALAGLGYVVIDVDYRLAPAFPWPAQRDDLRLALKYIRANALRWNLDPRRGVFLGRSAGAHLALAFTYLEKDPGIKGVVSFYGPADLFFAYQYGSPDDILRSLDLLKNFCGGTPTTAPRTYQEASPYFHVGPLTPPTLLLHGDIDALVWKKQSERLIAQLAQSSVRSQYVELPWATHGFGYNFQGPSGQLAWYSLQRFLASTLQ